MSITFANLKTEVAEAVRDPDGLTFDDAAQGRIVKAALAEVGRVMPEMFQEDITPVADTLEYVLRSDDFGGAAVPEIEVTKVEMWDGDETPSIRYYSIPPGHSEYVNDTQAGWMVWGGRLYLPNWVHTLFDGQEGRFVIRVWGYSPYVEPTADGDIIPISTDAQWALVSYAQAEALQRLLAERDLFTQWQTRSGNTDISPAGLMNMLTGARDEWRRRSRALLRLRSVV